jgi:hypothetical protein
VVLVGVLWLAFASSKRQAPPPAAAGQPDGGSVSIGDSPQTSPNFSKLTALDRYIEWIKLHEPTVTTIPRRDLVDGSSEPVPSVDMRDNFVGGEATDMMALTMGLDAREPRRPVPDRQEWELKTFTFPRSRATYMEVDFLNASSGLVPNAKQNMRGWDMQQLCPPLAALDPAHWTQDERHYAHYLTRRTMGFDDTETGFAALWAAYASNFALWHGDTRSVPAAAYYALAAAHFERHLAAGGPPKQRAVAVTWMVCGECYRVLGRLEDAKRCYGAARQVADRLDQAQAEGLKDVDVLKQPEKQVLKLYGELADAGNMDLQRQPFTGVPDPPTGWFIDTIFPAVNGDLAVERAQWAALHTPEEICAAINERIAAQHPGGAS